ncbi:MAG: alpha/beta hydrolase [Sphingomonas sp.]|nr:alpha/beta hydrolase [Sphingomonas sp.]MDX3884750.1 alpha/beta hydrolase [Sphingomonas sp.]
MTIDPTAFVPHRYRSACGRLELFARIYPGEGPTLLLMHGLTRNSADFEPLAPHLAGRYRLIVPDQRGRGLSDHDADPGNYRPDIYSADMFALLDGLSVDKAALIGTSMGGLMAMMMAAMQPDRISAIALNDIGPRLEPAGLARIQGYVGPGAAFANWAEAAARCAAINAEAFPGFTAEDWLAFARRTCREDGDGAVRFAYDPAIAGSIGGDEPGTIPPDLWPLWDTLSAKPVLVVRGALSDLLSPATVAEMARRHGGPFAHVEVPSRGHAPLLDEPAALGAIEHWLRGLPDGSI